jgi:hypothetical protein
MMALLAASKACFAAASFVLLWDTIVMLSESLRFHRRPLASFHATISNTSRCA